VSFLPKPLDWVDRATGGEPTVYLGQQITDANGLWQVEFWNPSIEHVWSTDGTAPGPGPTLTPDLGGLDGSLVPVPDGLRYAVTDGTIGVVGDVAAAGGPWRLTRIEDPLRLEYAVSGVYSDGWTGPVGAYSRYSTPGNRPGWIVVDMARGDWHSDSDVPSDVTVRVGELEIGEDHQPRLGRVTETRSWEARAFGSTRLVIPTPAPPFRVEIDVDPPFVPSQIVPGSGDVRELGVQAKFSYSPTRPEE
jgi:hypothetical protein